MLGASVYDVMCAAAMVDSCALAHWQATILLVQRGHYFEAGITAMEVV